MLVAPHFARSFYFLVSRGHCLCLRISEPTSGRKDVRSCIFQAVLPWGCSVNDLELGPWQGELLRWCGLWGGYAEDQKESTKPAPSLGATHPKHELMCGNSSFCHLVSALSHWESLLKVAAWSKLQSRNVGNTPTDQQCDICALVLQEMRFASSCFFCQIFLQDPCVILIYTKYTVF